MIDSLTSFFLTGFLYIKKHPQLILTMLLILVIPAAFLLSGQQFLKVSKMNQETLELERLGMLHDMVASMLRVTDFNVTVVEEELIRIAQVNQDIVEFLIVYEHNQSMTILGSNVRESVGAPVVQPDVFRKTNIDPTRPLSITSAEDGIRYWNSYQQIQAVNGDMYYVYIKTSLLRVDRLFSERITNAYYWLFGILGVVLLLLIRHVRLIDYAYLYSETKKANEMKDLFTNMIAHELRAPLTAMRGYASMIRENQANSGETKEHAHRIEDASGRLILIVTDLLDVARIHSGKLSIRNERFNIHKTIHAVIDAMQSSAVEKQISLISEISPREVYVTLDEKRLHQALTNLVSNSIKYTQAGTITVALEDRSDRIEIRVKDTGMGMSAEHQKGLFAPFFRIENTETTGTVGTGLGMWITKQLIELMNGSIAVESIKGVGTHIVVTLPKNS